MASYNTRGGNWTQTVKQGRLKCTKIYKKWPPISKEVTEYKLWYKGGKPASNVREDKFKV